MPGRGSGPSSRTQSRAASSAASFDAPRPAAHVAAVIAASHSLSALDSYAARRAQSRADGGEEEEGAVGDGGLDGGGGVATDSVCPNEPSGQVDVVRHGVQSGASGVVTEGPYHAMIWERECTLDTCTHCCKCHIRRFRNGYGSCMRRPGVPYADCECRGRCAAGQCAQRECVSRVLLESEPLSPVASVSGGGVEHKSPLRRTSSHVSSSPWRYEDVQAQERALAEFERPQSALRAAAAASSAAVAASSPVRTALPTIVDVASHRPLHSTIPFADHTVWVERRAPAFERYRQTSTLTVDDFDGIAAALVEVLRLPGTYLYKQRVHPYERRMLTRQQLQSGAWRVFIRGGDWCG